MSKKKEQSTLRRKTLVSAKKIAVALGVSGMLLGGVATADVVEAPQVQEPAPTAQGRRKKPAKKRAVKRKKAPAKKKKAAKRKRR